MGRYVDGVGRFAVHLLLQPRRRNNRAVAKFARTVPAGSRVLEFGSGRQLRGRYPYSAARFFSHCDIILTDIDPEFGHQVADVTDPPFENEFDAVIAASVLEHVEDLTGAVLGIHRALKPGGVAWVAVPFLYPLHDEPGDYWRITEHGLRLILSRFSRVEVTRSGFRKAPFAYYLTAVK